MENVVVIVKDGMVIVDGGVTVVGKSKIIV